MGVLSIVPSVDVLIPTYDNPQYLYSCLHSLVQTRGAYPFSITIINNGNPAHVGNVEEQGIHVLHSGKNLGWEGGLSLGLQHSTAEFVVFSNDDIFIPRVSLHWCRTMLSHFKSETVGAVGPSSNVVMGAQNIFAWHPASSYLVPYLIGFFCMIRRSALDNVGGLDTTLPGGDDLDLSIRLRKAGYSLLFTPDVFIYHHGFKTGERVHGTYWNSYDMQEKTDNALIKKHGMRSWMSLYHSPPSTGPERKDDLEGDAVRGWVTDGRVLEFGCGARKTVPWSIGVDIVPGGETTFQKQTSVASIMADVFAPMPQFEDSTVDTIIARHILEHALDLIQTLCEWRRILRPEGRLIVAYPNENIAPGIPMDMTHKHALTPDSLRTIVEGCGFQQLAYTPHTGNGVSGVSVFSRKDVST